MRLRAEGVAAVSHMTLARSVLSRWRPGRTDGISLEVASVSQRNSLKPQISLDGNTVDSANHVVLTSLAKAMLAQV